MSIQALDLFAGSGWGVACQRLGIDEHGVEIMPEAVATRDAAGMKTIFRDVWEGLTGQPRLLDEAERVERARVLAKPIEEWDEYDLLIASPPCQTFSMAGSRAGRRALNDVLGLIDSKAYTRPGDDLRCEALDRGLDDRTALVLTPLAYVYRHRPTFVALEQVPTVLPVWEAVAEVLRGLGYSVAVGVLSAERYGVPQTRKRAILVARRDGQEARLPEPTHSAYYSRDPKRLDEGVLPWVSMADALGRADFSAEKVMGRGMVERHGSRPGRDAGEPAFTIRASAGGMEPGGFVLRSNYGTGGDASKRGERPIGTPAPTLTSKADRNKWVRAEVAEWPQSDRPATVIQGDPRVPLRKHHSPESPQMDGALRLTAEEAAVLQSYPADFPFQGRQGKRFLQIGNAVPPLLAEAILRAVIS